MEPQGWDHQRETFWIEWNGGCYLLMSSYIVIWNPLNYTNELSIQLLYLVQVICIDYLNWIFSVQCIEELNFMKNLPMNTCNLIDCEDSTDQYWEVTNEVYGIFRFLVYWDGNQQWWKYSIYWQGNHGEDMKELFYYVDGLPDHSYMKAIYRYPQNEFPYEELLQRNLERNQKDPEFELTDTGCTLEFMLWVYT